MNALLKPSHGLSRVDLDPYDYHCVECFQGVLDDETSDALITLKCCKHCYDARIRHLVAIEEERNYLKREHGKMRHTLEQISRVELTKVLSDADKLLIAIQLMASIAISEKGVA